MQAAKRLGLAFLLMIAAFVALISIASASLWAAGQGMLALVVAVVGLGGGVAGAITYRIAQGEEPVEPLPASTLRHPVASPVRKPIRVQAMPVADLPPEYLAAVMKGTRARTHALRTQAQAQGRAH